MITAQSRDSFNALPIQLFLPDYAIQANSPGIHAKVRSTDHIDYRLQYNAIWFLSVWHMTVNRCGYRQDMVAVCHENSYDNRTASLPAVVVSLIDVLIAREIERTISIESTNQLEWIVNSSRGWSISIPWLRYRTEFFVGWQTDCVDSSRSCHHHWIRSNRVYTTRIETFSQCNRTHACNFHKRAHSQSVINVFPNLWYWYELMRRQILCLLEIWTLDFLTTPKPMQSQTPQNTM